MFVREKDVDVAASEKRKEEKIQSPSTSVYSPLLFVPFRARWITICPCRWLDVRRKHRLGRVRKWRSELRDIRCPFASDSCRYHRLFDRIHLRTQGRTRPRE